MRIKLLALVKSTAASLKEDDCDCFIRTKNDDQCSDHLKAPKRTEAHGQWVCLCYWPDGRFDKDAHDIAMLKAQAAHR